MWAQVGIFFSHFHTVENCGHHTVKICGHRHKVRHKQESTSILTGFLVFMMLNVILMCKQTVISYMYVLSLFHFVCLTQSTDSAFIE